MILKSESKWSGECHIRAGWSCGGALARMVMRLEELAAEEFRQDEVRGADGEEFRQAGAQGVGDDELGRRTIAVHGA